MLKKLTTYSFALLGILVFFNSCKKEYESIESIDDAKIQAYIKQNSLSMTKDATGFYYQVVSNGTGAPLLNKDSVFYNLTMKSLEGVVYYNTTAFSNEGNYLGYLYPSSYRLALEGKNRGSKVRVILPSYLAYGRSGNTAIPPNEVIVTEIETYEAPRQIDVDDTRIINFLASKGLTATKDPSRVYYQIIEMGTGQTVDLNSTVTTKYTGRLLTGGVFDQTTGDQTYALTMSVGNFIKGWEILLGKKKGSKIRVFIPSDLAYGTAADATIPANSVLDFDIEIVDVTN